MIVLVAVVTGCGGAHRYDSRLVAVDSLLQVNPDSALALVEALTPDSLANDGDRAYCDLLVTQARYKCYITATSDSDINHALNYYRRHSGDREKLTRAYIYKGAVMDELNHPDSAMFYYKTAEVTVAPTDYYNLGYTNFRIGKLYQYDNTADSLVIMKMRKALMCFIACRDTDLIVKSMGALGSYLFETDKDSATIMLNQAISLAQSIHSQDQFLYQSKLSGHCFYHEDYTQAKNLAMDIINNGKDLCDEHMFYYYAARSFIKLGQLDSAIWVQSIIPAPVLPQDSFNYYLLQAELAKASHNMLEYGLCSAKAERIHRRLVENSSKEKLLTTELECDASQKHSQLTTSYKNRMLWIAALVFIALMIILLAVRALFNNRKKRFQQELNFAQREIKRIIDNSEQHVSKLLAQRRNDQLEIKKIKKELSSVTKKYHKLEQQQLDVHEQASAIVRGRNAALNELYNDIRVRIEAGQDDRKTTIPLFSLLRDYNENRKMRILTPKESFWSKLKSSVDLEYNGIASFVEKNYPSLSVREHHLFWLLCANISPHIIRLCMDYSTTVTVSNNKRRLMKDKMGLDIKFEDFISQYLNGELENSK